MNLPPIAIIVSIFALFALSRVFLQWRNNNVSVFAIIFWSFIWTGVLILVWWPNLLERVSNVVGIQRGVDLLVYGGMLLLFYLSYRLYVRHEETEQNLTKIVREIALKDLGK